MKQSLGRQTAAALSACVITFALFLLYYAFYGIYPCGSNAIVWCDMEQQTVPILMQLKQIVQRGESIAYTALDAGGMSFYGIFFFFLSNPFSLLILCTDIRADLLVTMLVIIKLSLASGTASLWFGYRIPQLKPAPQILLSMMYGCCGYGLFYYQNLMWLDVMVLVPILLISLDLLVKRQKPILYFLTLCTMMVLCFYLCYMMVLFLLLYTALTVRFQIPETQRGKAAARLWGTSLLAACLTAPVWLPCFLQVMHSARSEGIIPMLMHTYPFDSLPDKLALLGCTGLALAAIPLVFSGAGRRHTAARDRRLFLLLFAATVLDPINAMWHTGSYQAFPYRWGMLSVLLLLTVAAANLTAKAQTLPTSAVSKRKRCLILGLLLTAVIAANTLLIKAAGERILSYIHSLWIDTDTFLLLLIPFVLLGISYFTVIRMYRQRSISERVCTGLLAVLFAAEFTLNFHCYIGEAADEDGLFVQTVAAANQINDDSFYRVRMTKKYAHVNMLGALGYPTLAHYTSMTREDFLYGVKRMGYSSYWMEVSSTGGTVLTDALWSIRYLLGTRMDFPAWTETVWSNDRLSIAYSSMQLPSVLYVDAAPEEIADLPAGSRAGVQAYLGEQMLGLTGFITEYPPTRQTGLTLTETESEGFVCTLNSEDAAGEIRFSFFVSGSQALYFDLYSQTNTEIGNARNKAISVTVNGRTVMPVYPENSSNGLFFLRAAKNEYVTVSVAVQKDFQCESFGVFGMDLEQLTQAMQTADGAELSYRSGVYTAHCDTDAPTTAVLSVPYDEGLTAEVNGKSVPVYRVNACQTAVCLPAGESDLTLRFHVSGLRTGFCIAACGLLGALLWCMLRRRISARQYTAIGRGAVLLLRIAYGGILLAVYIFPLVVSLSGMLLQLLFAI